MAVESWRKTKKSTSKALNSQVNLSNAIKLSHEGKARGFNYNNWSEGKGNSRGRGHGNNFSPGKGSNFKSLYQRRVEIILGLLFKEKEEVTITERTHFNSFHYKKFEHKVTNYKLRPMN